MSSQRIKIMLGLEFLFAALAHKATVASRPVPKAITVCFILNCIFKLNVYVFRANDYSPLQALSQYV